MEGFADLLTDAFSESSIPSFSTGDLEFENLCFDEKSEEEQSEGRMSDTDEAQLQQPSAEGAALPEGPTADALYRDENAYGEQTDEESHEEDLRGVSFGNKTPEDDCTSSDGDEEQDEEKQAESSEEEGDGLVSICSSGDVLDSKKQGGILDDEDSELLEDADQLQVGNKLQEEVDSDEEEEALGCRNDKMVTCAESEEDEQEREEDSESNYEGMQNDEETENPNTVSPGDCGLEFPSITFQNLQDLISAVDCEVYEEKISDFTGDEHQEAGESFADYPSDLSSGEYGRNPVNLLAVSPRPREEESLEGAVTETLRTHSSEEADCEKEDEFLFSGDTEMNAGRMRRHDEATGEEGEKKSEHLLTVTHFDDEEKLSDSDSYSSSDDEEPLRRSSDVFSVPSRAQDLEDNTKLESIKFYGGGCSDDQTTIHDRYDPDDFPNSGSDVLETKTFQSEYLQITEDTDETDSPASDMNPCPGEDFNGCHVEQRESSETKSPSVQGSIDDSFFFNNEPNNFTEDQQEEEDEYEERRSFEQMKQRIEAFQKFYNEIGREERQTKVQFCADPLSQINYYETDSSDRESLSGSSDREEDPSSAEQSDDPQEPEEDVKPVIVPPAIQQLQTPTDIIDTQTCTETRQSISTLKLIGTLGVVTVTGLLMFCLTTDQPEWLRQLFFF